MNMKPNGKSRLSVLISGKRLQRDIRVRCLRLIPALVTNFLFFAFVAAVSSASGQLTATVSVSSTSVREAALFTANVLVTNTGTARANQVYIYADAGGTLQPDTAGTGYAVPLKHVKPLISAINPGKSLHFTQQFRATTSGTFRLVCVAHSFTGDTDPVYSPTVTVLSRRVGPTATSDPDGTALVAIGRTRIPLHISDETTGSSLGGLSLGLALDPFRKGQAVLAAVDLAGRYPPQFLLLQGPVATAGAGPKVAAASTPDAGAPTPVEIPIDQSCGGDGEAFTRVMAPIHTSYLPTLKPVPVPTGLPKPGDDLNQPTFAVMRNALMDALATARGFVVKKQKVPCDQVLETDGEVIKQIPANATGDMLLYTPLKAGIELFAPETSGVMFIDQSLRTISSGESIVSMFHDFYLCNATDAEVLDSTTLLPGLPQYALIWNSPAAPDPTQVPLTELSLNATDANGQPISGGSLQLVSYDELGLGVRAIIGDGSADVPVPVGNYNWCVRAPGYETQSGTITMNSTPSNLQVALLPQPIASATLTTDLGQPTGLLPQGTQFVLTPHFFDAKGNEVQCTGKRVFTIKNPLRSPVASVDPDTGLVTILGGCGAALVTVWCDGVPSAPRLISSDCNGTEPLAASPSFAVNPTQLTFVAKEGGANPAPQRFYWIVLSASGVSATEEYGPTSWLSDVSASGSDYDTVSVNISGLRAGTYDGHVRITDNANSAYTTTVHVTLIINPVPTAGVAGIWRGTYSFPFDDVGDMAKFNVVWNLVQNGNSVIGTYGQIEDGSTQQTNGDLNGGSIEGNQFLIYSDGGLEFIGTVSGNTISGTVGTGSLPGTFSVTKQ